LLPDGLPPVRTTEARADIERGFQVDEQAGWPAKGQKGALDIPLFRFPGFADTKPLAEWLKGRNIAIFGCDLWTSDWLPMTPQAELKLTMERLEKMGPWHHFYSMVRGCRPPGCYRAFSWS
jgi:hypothetical protein